MKKSSAFPHCTITLSACVVREPTDYYARTPEEIARLLEDTGRLAQEAFTVLTLNTRHRIIGRHLITLGLVNECLVHTREVFRTAIADGATTIVLSHNHPGGDPSPSSEDLKITRRMIDAGNILGIHVLDHVIIGRGAHPYVSLRESGLVAFGS